MKILHLITSLKLGGAESVLVNLLTNLKPHGHEHLVIYFHGGPNIARIQELGITTQQIRGRWSTYDPIMFYKLKSHIQAYKPNLIHSALWSANILGRIIAKQLQIPIICDLHNNCAIEGRLRNFLDRRTAHIPHQFIAVSCEVKKAYSTTILSGIKDPHLKSDDRITVIKNGIDAATLHHLAQKNPFARSSLAYEPTDFIIGAIGRLEAVKSYHLLLGAFALFFKNTQQLHALHGTPRLCLVGDGTCMHALKNQAEQLLIAPHVTFMGFRSDAYRFYPLFDCFALSSQNEGISIALLEALTFGLPIITTAPNLAHEVIEDGRNGLLVPINNELLLADAIKKLYLDKELCIKMQADNIKLVQERYRIEGIIPLYLAAYQRAIFRQFESTASSTKNTQD